MSTHEERQVGVARAGSGPERQVAVAQAGSGPERQVAVAQAGSGPAASQAPAAPARQPRNAISLGPRTRRVIRAVARVVNPLVLRMAGRRYMPIVGVVHHRGRKTGRSYATPLGVRPAPGGGFVIPLTFSEASQWYQNILAAGWCVITYRATDHTVAAPVVVDRATAGPAYPRYERLALRLIGINEFLWLAETGHKPGPAVDGA
jgi:deazaflavin-dependent oxidoreductase (nitroreductase family)